MKRKVCSILIALVLMIIMIPSIALAAVVDSGTCGDNLTWTFDDAGTLTISGTGAMPDYLYSYNSAPWYEIRENIETVIIKKGVTSIGNYTFYKCISLTGITIPNSVTSIGGYAFDGCSSLASITIPDGVTSIGWNAFEGCSSLTSITIPDGVTTIDYGVFQECSNLKSITIPDSVTDIRGDAFYDCISLTGITLPNSVITIGNAAFEGCSSLTSISIPDSVTTIGKGAFAWCSNLTSIRISEGVASIGNGAFKSCLRLANIYVSDRNQYFQVIEGVLFDKNASHLIVYPAQKTEKTYTIPDSVIEIDDYAFSRCSSLTSVTIPESVTSIGNYTFSACYSLADITIPDNVIFIGDGAFEHCYNITSIVIPDGVTSISDGTFLWCEGLTDITIPNSVVSIDKSAFYRCDSLSSIAIPKTVSSIGDDAFSFCNSLKYIFFAGSESEWGDIVIANGNDKLSSCKIYYDCITKTGTCGENITYTLQGGVLTIEGNGNMTDYQKNTAPWYELNPPIVSVIVSDGITHIGNYAFYGCSGLTSITIPDDVTSIGNYAFYDCNSLVNIAIPDDVTSIGNYAFYGCSSLTNITMPNDITSIGNYTFYDCSNLTSIIIPDSMTSIGEGAFGGCTSLTSITIPEGVTSIGECAFYHCNSLTGITLPKGITSIGNNVFDSCRSLVEVDIPESVTSIGRYAFYNCSRLTSITIPDGVTDIGDYAFSRCSNLASITIPDGVTAIGKNEFSSCSSLSSITIPNSITIIGDSAFNGCRNLVSIVIPDGVTTIGTSAFSGCSSLVSIAIPDGVTTIGNAAFNGCNSLASINVDDKNKVFQDIDGVLFNKDASQVIAYPAVKNGEKYVIPNSVNSIGNYAFSYCTNLTSITIPDSVISIGERAFSYCSNLTDITIPETVNSIGNGAFYSCRSLTSITIPNGIPSIGGSLFSSCRGLKSVTIPDSVSSVGYLAFYMCDGLTDVYYLGSNDDWENISVGNGNDWLTNATIHYSTGNENEHSHTSAANWSFDGTSHWHNCTADDCDEKLDNAAHEYGDWDITQEPTATEKGSKKHSCTVCGYEETAEIPATGENTPAHTHTYGEPTRENEVAATCTTKGSYDEVIKCTECGEEVSRTTKTIDIIEHTVVKDEAVAATCGTAGKTEGSHCSVCDTVIVAQTEIAATGDHTYSDWTTTKEPTVTESGSKERTCSVCNHTETAEIPATGDNTPAHTHTYGEPTRENEVAATCTTKGSYDEVIKCTECGEEVSRTTKTIDMIEHTVVKDEAVAATCGTAGKTEGSHCSVCNTVIVAQEEIAATGDHTYGDWVTTKDATATESGSKERTCSVCKHTETAEIPATGENSGTGDNSGEGGNSGTDDKQPETTQDTLAALTQKDNVTPAEVREALDGKTDELHNAMLADKGEADGVVSQIEELEEKIDNVTVKVKIDESVTDFTADKVTIVGAKLNATSGEDAVTLKIAAAEGNFAVADTYDSSKTVKFSMDLEGVDTKTTLTIPVRVTLPIPSGMNSDKLVILHYGSDGKVAETLQGDELQITGDSSQYYVSFVLDHFSDFAMTQTKTTTNTPAGGGGGAVTTTYTVTAATATNGKVTVNSTSIAKGDTVTITATPNSGYAVDKITVTDANGKAVTVTANDGKYTFTMPAANVTVTSIFKADESKSADPFLTATKFADVTAGAWYEEAINYAQAKGLMNGETATDFRPNNNMTRAMLMTVLARLDGTDTTGGSVWYEKGMNWAVSKSVSDGSDPNGNITREQLATMLYRYAGTPEATGTAASFSDSAKISDYATEAMNWAVGTGLLNGNDDGTLNPVGNATRAEVATILMRFIENVFK